MSYLKKPKGRATWYIIDKARGTSVSTGTGNKREAEAARREYDRRQAGQGGGRARDNPEIGEVWGLYASLVKGAITERTLTGTHIYRWNRFQRWVTSRGGVSRMRDVTVGVCNEYRAWLHDRAGALEAGQRTEQQAAYLRRAAMRGFNADKRTLQAIWNVLIESERFSGANPWVRVRGVDKSVAGEESESSMVLSPRQVSALFAALQSEGSLLRVAQCGYYLGARRGEILGLRWEHVNFDAGTVRLGGKQGRYRTIEVPRVFLDVLRADRGAPLGWVVKAPSDERGTKGLRWNWNRQWRRVCRSLGLLKPCGDAIGVHDLRHSYATHLVEQGVGAQDVQRLLGHSTLRMTERYTHLTNQRRVTDVLDRLVPGVSEAGQGTL